MTPGTLTTLIVLPARSSFFTSCFSSQVNLEKKTTCPPPSSSVVLRSSDDPRLIIISLSQSDVAIDPAADHSELVGLEASGRRHIRLTSCPPPLLIESRTQGPKFT